MITDLFDLFFSTHALQERFENKILFSASQGLDRVSPRMFNEKLEDNLEIINRKVMNMTYAFTKYNELLVSKGRNKPPRVIGRPTVRDKLTLSALHAYLQESYKNELDTRLIHTKINEIINNINSFTHYIKIDIQKFYPSLNHDILNKLLRDRLDDRALHLINSAITTPTVQKEFNSKLSQVSANTVGVPEGLSISNILADIYLLDFDNYYKSIQIMHYCRYVDDILILCHEKDAQHIKRELGNRLNDLYLNPHEDTNVEKIGAGLIENGFNYLGYKFSKDIISVRESSIDRFEHAVENLFSEFKRKNIRPELLIWKLNLKITGCIFENRKYGWLFYYSQINNLNLLKHFDWLINKLLLRYKVEMKNLSIPIKTFVKTYYEIRYNLHSSDYLLNADRLSIEDKAKIIGDIYGKLIPAKEKEVNRLFSKTIRLELRELEKDVQFFS